VSVVVPYTILEFVFGMSLYTGKSRLAFIWQWLRSLRRGSTAGHLLGMWARFPPVTWMFVSCECYMFWGRVLCVALIIRPEESYRLRCVWEWSRNFNNKEV
jgi:hypothetical protein